MIRMLKGKIISVDENSIILDTVFGVGYRVFMNTYSVQGKIKHDIKVFIHMSVRENSITLFGFFNSLELKIFELLITVSGVGPKVGMNILSMSTPISIKKSIITGDISGFTKISGIGKKVAEKIILELKTKVDKMKIVDENGIENAFDNDFDIEIYETLETLGFSKNQIRDTLEKLPKDIATTEEKIKKSLKLLAK